VPTGRWGGRVLVTHRRPDGRYERFTADAPSSRVELDTARADLAIGASAVRQRNGVYGLVARASGPAGPLRLDLEVRPEPNRYFPPVELRDGHVYHLRADPQGRRCQPYLEDAADTKRR